MTSIVPAKPLQTRPSAIVTTLPPQPMRSALETPLGTIVRQYEATLAPFLRNGVTLERVAAELVLASRQTPHLDKCRPEVLVDKICRALETGGIIGQDVYVVPYFDSKNKAYQPSVIIDYKYLAEMTIAAGGAKSIGARCVYANEEFAVHYGTDERIIHRPSMDVQTRGALLGAYAVAQIGYNSPPKFEWMLTEEIEAIRARSRQWNPEKFPALPTWYAKKTTIRQLVKLLVKNPRLKAVQTLIQHEEEEEFGPTMDESIPVSAVPQGAEENSDEELLAQDREIAAADELPLGDSRRTQDAVRSGR